MAHSKKMKNRLIIIIATNKETKTKKLFLLHACETNARKNNGMEWNGTVHAFAHSRVFSQFLWKIFGKAGPKKSKSNNCNQSKMNGWLRLFCRWRRKGRENNHTWHSKSQNGGKSRKPRLLTPRKRCFQPRNINYNHNNRFKWNEVPTSPWFLTSLLSLDFFL